MSRCVVRKGFTRVDFKYIHTLGYRVPIRCPRKHGNAKVCVRVAQEKSVVIQVSYRFNRRTRGVPHETGHSLRHVEIDSSNLVLT
jgi:hypothetical protein